MCVRICVCLWDDDKSNTKQNFQGMNTGIVFVAHTILTFERN